MMDGRVPSDTVVPSKASRVTNESAVSDGDRNPRSVMVIGTVTVRGRPAVIPIRKPSSAAVSRPPAVRTAANRSTRSDSRRYTAASSIPHGSPPANGPQFERAYADERTDIRWFRLQALGTLLLVYFCLLFLYAVVT